MTAPEVPLIALIVAIIFSRFGHLHLNITVRRKIALIVVLAGVEVGFLVDALVSSNRGALGQSVAGICAIILGMVIGSSPQANSE